MTARHRPKATRVVVIGPECAGKTTLASELAAEFDAPWTREAARLYAESTTEPLSAPVHVSGVPGVSLRLAFSAPAAIVSAMLVDYRASGPPFIVSRGWADPQNRESIEKTTPVVPGRVYNIDFELQPHDYIFAAGSRIALMVLSSDQLFTQHPPAGTRLTLRIDDSRVRIPVVGGAKAFDGAVTRAARQRAAMPAAAR